MLNGPNNHQSRVGCGEKLGRKGGKYLSAGEKWQKLPDVFILRCKA